MGLKPNRGESRGRLLGGGLGDPQAASRNDGRSRSRANCPYGLMCPRKGVIDNRLRRAVGQAGPFSAVDYGKLRPVFSNPARSRAQVGSITPRSKVRRPYTKALRVADHLQGHSATAAIKPVPSSAERREKS
jgi:hypothetical protein